MTKKEDEHDALVAAAVVDIDDDALDAYSTCL